MANQPLTGAAAMAAQLRASGNPPPPGTSPPPAASPAVGSGPVAAPRNRAARPSRPTAPPPAPAVAPATPPATPPPAPSVAPAASAAPRRSRATRGTLPRWWLGFFLGMALTALGMLFIANLAGLSPAVVKMERVRVVLPQTASPAALPQQSAPADEPLNVSKYNEERLRCGVGHCWQPGDPVPNYRSAPPPQTYAPLAYSPQPYYKPAPSWQLQGHGDWGNRDNPIVWRRYVLPGGSEVMVPGPWRQ